MGAPLVTLEDYKTYKKITKTDADVELQYIIDSVNVLVRTFVGHSIIDYYSTPIVEVFNVKQGQSGLQLNEWPIIQIVSIESRGDYDQAYTVMDPAEYHVDPSVDCVFIHGKSAYWPEGYGSTKVTYKAGYATVPLDLRLACLDLVHHYYKEEYKERRQIGNASIDNTNRSSMSLASEWPIHIIRILDMYRNI
jgi:hypothetical protein